MPDRTASSDAHRRQRAVAETIAFAFRDGAWSASLLARRAAHDLDVPVDAWLMDMAIAAVERFVEPPVDQPRAVAEFVDHQLDSVVAGEFAPPVVAWIAGAETQWVGVNAGLVPEEMAERRWDVPAIATASELASLLNLDPASLEWFADARSLERTATDKNLRHYDYHWIPKRRGGARLVEAPKQNLKYLQRWILRNILHPIPPHPAAHGFRHAHSIQTFASPHTGREWVARMDLRDFFPSVSGARVYAIFHAAGYPHSVAKLLCGLTTNATPVDVLHGRGTNQSLLEAKLRDAHLPQGAPSSPALANLAAFNLDCRLSALAERFDVRYTRYADDLAFSGNGSDRREVDRLLHLAETIVRDEGFSVNRAKSSIRRKHERQVLTGMVVNQHLNLHRRDLDRLRAELHEAVTLGPSRANRTGHPQYRAHLEGRLGFVQATNPTKARKLWRMFDKIDWS